MSAKVLGTILAGGASQRFGSNKLMASLGGVTLLRRVITRARPQVDKLVMSAAVARVTELFVVRDATPLQGPLSGIVASLQWGQAHGFDLVATFACDVPFVPMDLVERMRKDLRDDVDCVMARRGADIHYVFGLWRTKCADRLGQAFEAGLRKMRDVTELTRLGFSDFPTTAEAPNGDAFYNINCREDLQIAELWLASKMRPK